MHLHELPVGGADLAQGRGEEATLATMHASFAERRAALLGLPGARRTALATAYLNEGDEDVDHGDEDELEFEETPELVQEAERERRERRDGGGADDVAAGGKHAEPVVVYPSASVSALKTSPRERRKGAPGGVKTAHQAVAKSRKDRLVPGTTSVSSSSVVQLERSKEERGNGNNHVLPTLHGKGGAADSDVHTREGRRNPPSAATIGVVSSTSASSGRGLDEGGATSTTEAGRGGHNKQHTGDAQAAGVLRPPVASALQSQKTSSIPDDDHRHPMQKEFSKTVSDRVVESASHVEKNVGDADPSSVPPPSSPPQEQQMPVEPPPASVVLQSPLETRESSSESPKDPTAGRKGYLRAE